MASGERQGRASLPSVDRVLRGADALIERYGRVLVTEAVREALAEHRKQGVEADAEVILAETAAALVRLMRKSQRRVFNLTGTVLHTNLGRAPLPEEAIAAAVEAMREPTTLEYETDGGRRGERDDHVAGWLKRLSGAEAALTVNNNAGALVLVLNALAAGKETIVSRGELIEIGGAFRLPDIMARAGTILREVGTTNRTHPRDFAAAIGPQTGLILKVHTSNYAIQGFTAAAPTTELAALVHRHNLPLVEDLGSGTLMGLERWGLPHEPTVAEALKAGADLVTFSGDKLLGGPQAGIIAGKKELVTNVRRHPLFRALRVDKLTTAALEVTLGAYLRGAWDEIPALRMIRTSAAELKRRAENFLRELRPELPLDEVEMEIVDGTSLAGGGSTPTQSLPTKIIRIASARYSAAQLEQRLRRAPAGVSVIARVENDRLILDLRTVFPEQEPLLIKTLGAVLH